MWEGLEGRTCTETQNCSQNERQFRMLPLNVGTSSFGSFTPLLSEAGSEVVMQDEILLLIATHVSKGYFSR